MIPLICHDYHNFICQCLHNNVRRQLFPNNLPQTWHTKPHRVIYKADEAKIICLIDQTKALNECIVSGYTT